MSPALAIARRLATAAIVAAVALASGARGEDIINGHGLLWRIEAPGVPASHLFGTMHSPDPRVLALPGAAARAFAAADTLVIELRTTGDAGAAAAQALFQSMLLDDDRSLSAMLGERPFAVIAEGLAKKGLPAAIVDKLRPWGAYLMLMAPPRGEDSEAMVLDQRLETEALRGGKTVAALETLDEQVAVFAGMAEADMVRLLLAIIETAAEAGGLAPYIDDFLEAVTGHYLDGDLAAILALSRTQLPGGDAALAERLMTRMIDDRNHRFADRLNDALRKGGAFIAVGALHLPGETGLVALLESRGFTVGAVP